MMPKNHNPIGMDLCAHEGEIPIPTSSTFVSAQSHGGHYNPFINHHDPSNGPRTIIPTPTAEPQCNKKGSSAPVRYIECLKNHAASIGGNATDGCGEFMPGAEEGRLEALKCSACGCHRNFHRKEMEGAHNYSASWLICAHGYPQRPTPRNMIMPLGAAQTSESEEMEGAGVGYPRPPLLKKRARTKFSAEQKEKMLAFAERAGWRLQGLEEGAVQRFCQEVGLKRRVLKVWMHNNKHTLAKKAPLPSSFDERMNE